jgi:hypothetical protein
MHYKTKINTSDRTLFCTSMKSFSLLNSSMSSREVTFSVHWKLDDCYNNDNTHTQVTVYLQNTFLTKC